VIQRALVGEILKMAWSSLRANKLRSSLTVLGVVIGVSTVIAMVSLIQGLNDSFKHQVQSFGSNTIYIRKWRPQVFIGELPDSLRQRKAFTVDDRDAILARCPSVRAVAPINLLGEPQPVRYRHKETKPTLVLGTDQAYQETNGYDVSVGRFFTQEEVDHREQGRLLRSDRQRFATARRGHQQRSHPAGRPIRHREAVAGDSAF